MGDKKERRRLDLKEEGPTRDIGFPWIPTRGRDRERGENFPSLLLAARDRNLDACVPTASARFFRTTTATGSAP